MEESEHLKNLEELIPLLSDLTISNSPDTEYDVGDIGTCFGFYIYQNDKIAVQRAFMSKGTMFPNHTHDEKEYVVVYMGKIKVLTKNKRHLSGAESKKLDYPILGVGDGIFFKQGEPHSVEALEDSWLICMTIPPGKGYPSDK